MSKFTDFAIKWGFLIVMGTLFLVFGLAEPAFWNPGNLFNILLSVCIFGTMALGETFVLVIDGMDLSIGSTAALSVMIAAYCMVVLEMGGFVTVLICLALGLLIGFINGFLIVKVKIPALLATLGIMFLVQGAPAHPLRRPIHR